MKAILQVQMTLLSDAVFGNGASIPGGEDMALRTDAAGFPLLAGATFKGLLRESVTDLLCWQEGDTALTALLFGSPERSGAEQRRLIFSDLRLDNPPADPDACVSLRTFTELQNGIVQQGSLRTAASLHRGLKFTGVLLCDPQDAEMLQQAAQGIKWAGLLRHRGFGRVRTQLTASKEINDRPTVGAAALLRYRLRLLTPLSVPWLSRSIAPGENLNHSQTRKYLPGSAVRGMVLNHIAQAQPALFEAQKATLMERLRFSDALPVLDGAPALPTPKGFYEDKAGKIFYSVLEKGEVLPGDKRAALGAFCVVQNGCLHTGAPTTASAVRITRKNREMFTVQRLEEGQELEGTIRLPAPELAPLVAAAFGRYVWLGADRYAGSGLCEVVALQPADAPAWQSLGYQQGDSVPETLYMMAVSPLAMEKNGSVCGLDEQALAAALGVQRVQLRRCATSLTESVGYNRTWGCYLPSIPMYESGSMFQLECEPAPTAAALLALQAEGLGQRRAEGCGQVLFWKNYPALRRAPADEANERIQPTAADRLRRARCRWLLQTKLPAGLSPSQLGTLQAECERGIQAKSSTGVFELLNHNSEERGAIHGKRFVDIQKFVERLLDTSVYDTLQQYAGDDPLQSTDVPDDMTERLRLLCDLIDLSRKKGGERR